MGGCVCVGGWVGVCICERVLTIVFFRVGEHSCVRGYAHRYFYYYNEFITRHTSGVKPCSEEVTRQSVYIIK